METLVFVEELGRNGEVIRRQAINKLPARIGRSYDSDVIIDDPHVAADHLSIRHSAEGALEVVDLGSLNGTFKIGDKNPISTILIQGDETFRIGKTQLRIRLPSSPVPVELPLPRLTWDRHPLAFFGAALFFIGYVAFDRSLGIFTTDSTEIISTPIYFFLFLLVWASVWSLVGRTMHGVGNFMAHGIVAFLGVSILFMVESMNEYLGFAFDLHGMHWVWLLCSSTVLAGIFYRHLRLTARLSPRILGIVSVFISASIVGGLEAYGNVKDETKPGLQSFGRTIKPSAFLFAKGITPDQFINIANHLKVEADKDAEPVHQ